MSEKDQGSRPGSESAPSSSRAAVRGPGGARPAPPAPLPAGHQVGERYRIEQVLGQGGMGTVYLAHDLAGSERVALKLVSGPSYLGAEGQLRFRREFHTMALLRHPNTVAVFDYGETSTPSGPALYYTMEHVQGVDLDRAAPLDMEMLGHVLVEISRALAFIHARGHVHRDLKPQNVRLLDVPATLLAWGGRAPPAPGAIPMPRVPATRTELGGTPRVKVMDFGLMEPIGARRRGDLYGTPSFVPPEVVRGAPIDGRSDLFALGVMAYWLLTGRLPFPSKSIRTSARLAEIPPEAPSRHPNYAWARSAGLDELVLELLAADPAERPASAEEVIERLAHIFGAHGVRADVGEAGRRSYLVAGEPVGRQRELERLRYLVEQARVGGGGALLLCAPAGLGKSRLLEAGALQARLEGMQVLQVAGREGGHEPHETLRRLLRPLQPRLSAVARSQADSLGVGPEILRILPELRSSLPRAPASSPDASRSRGDPQQERIRAVKGLIALVRAVSRQQPVAMLIDDLPRADGASIQALAALAEASSQLRLVLMAAARSDEVHRLMTVEAWTAVPHLELGPLQTDDVARLLRALFGRIEIPPAFVRDLHVAAGGNPYYLTEILRALCDDGVIRQVAGRFVLPTALVEVATPPGLDELLERRLGRLPGPAYRLLEAFSVHSREVPLSTLKNVFQGAQERSPAGEEGGAEGASPLDEAGDGALFAALDALLQAGLLEQDADSSHYRFHHPRLREILYGRLTAAVRAELHQQAGRALLLRYRGREGAHAAELGHHLARSRDPADRRRGSELLQQAGEAHFAAESYVDAVAPYQDALAVIDAVLEGRPDEGPAVSREVEEERRRHIWERLSRIGFYSDFALADRYLGLLLNRYRADADYVPGSPVLRLRLAGAAARRLLWPPAALVAASGPAAGEPEPGPWAKLLQPRLAAAKVPLERLFVTLSYLATTLANLGRLEESKRLSDELLPMVVAPHTLEAAAYWLARMTALVHQGRFGEVQGAVDRAAMGLSDQRMRVDPYDRLMAEGGLITSKALALALRGHPAWPAEQARLVGFAEERNLDFFRMTAHLVATAGSSVRGDRAAAVEALQTYVGYFRTLGRSAYAYRLYPWVALAEIEVGQLAAARAHLETFLETAPPGYFQDGIGSYLTGELALAAGDPAEAETAFSRGLEWAERAFIRAPFLASRCRLGRGEVALLEGRAGEAADLAQAVLEVSQAPPTRCERDHIRARRLLGRAQVLSGDRWAGQRHLEASLTLARGLDNPLETALGHSALARTLEQSAHSAHASEHAAQAERIFRQLGNDAAARRLRVQLRGVWAAPAASGDLARTALGAEGSDGPGMTRAARKTRPRTGLTASMTAAATVTPGSDTPIQQTLVPTVVQATTTQPETARGSDGDAASSAAERELPGTQPALQPIRAAIDPGDSDGEE